MNVIFTCGGTGGHINPAIAVANMMKQRYPDCKILFIGATGRMEEKLVPKAGFDLKCLDYIKLGPYIESLGGLKSPLTNQALYSVRPDGSLEKISII